jgi:hypothetical protein
VSAFEAILVPRLVEALELLGRIDHLVTFGALFRHCLKMSSLVGF